MPGLLATEVATLIKASLSAFENISEIYGDTANTESLPLSNAESLPPAFHDVGKHVPTVCEVLQEIRKRVRERKDDSTCAGMKSIAEECKRKADCVEKLFSKVIPSDKKMECYRTAVREMGNESRIEDLMKDAMKDIQLLLTIDEEMQLATKSYLELLIKSMKEVSAIPQSLQDEGPALGFHNYGSGPQNVNTGSGPQNNNNDKGIQVNGGTFNNVNPFQPQ
ncbi:hypothetical protein TGAMA5MH_06579 [Trichoderma gamsii]|uniref:NACHT-NTPase and P-loop NTPases N-terminal domain-containing protein n=1 Tax=Trichoderma gamsii TaxID=398673 RepID=A0A2K0T7H7_9HYPO|nr:hypothetical protein TGAMA5MH_06579 [Trichoderma gamsii]